MPIWTQLLKKWVGPDPEKHTKSTPPLTVFGAVYGMDVCMYHCISCDNTVLCTSTAL